MRYQHALVKSPRSPSMTSLGNLHSPNCQSTNITKTKCLLLRHYGAATKSAIAKLCPTLATSERFDISPFGQETTSARQNQVPFLVYG